MKLSEVNQAYSILWRQLSGKNLGGNSALRRLGNLFESPNGVEERGDEDRPMTIVLLDELDLLLRKRSTMLYHFFEWTGWAHSKLIVIAVANTMDLPERFLPNRIASRMGTNRINFRPYTYPQLMQIISHRYGGALKALFHPDALEYCGRKVSAVSGDARRALSLVKRAVDWIKANPSLLPPTNKIITIPLMDQAIQLTFVGNPVQIMSDLSFQAKTLLLSLLLASKAQARPALPFSTIVDYNVQILKVNSISTIPSFTELQRLLIDLEGHHLISLGSPTQHATPVVRANTMVKLCVPEDEVATALKGNPVFQRHLSAAFSVD